MTAAELLDDRRLGRSVWRGLRPTQQTGVEGLDRKPRNRGPTHALLASVDTTPGRSMSSPSSLALPVILLLASNVFMTFAWYGHLKFTDRPLWLVILASWGIALFEYCLAVPANRYGSFVYSPAQLKTIQEVITLLVFAVFSVFYLKTQLTLNHAVGFALIAAGAFFVFRGPF